MPRSQSAVEDRQPGLRSPAAHLLLGSRRPVPRAFGRSNIPLPWLASLTSAFQGWGFGFKEPSSSSDPSTSGGSSGSQSASDNSGGELPRIADLPVQLASNAAIAQLLPALVQPLHATVPHMRGARRRSVHAHHPDDWQWVHAGHVLHALHPGIAGAALAAFFAAVLAGWHRIAFP